MALQLVSFNCHKMLSKNGNPTHNNLVALLDILGLKLGVKPEMDQA